MVLTRGRHFQQNGPKLYKNGPQLPPPPPPYRLGKTLYSSLLETEILYLLKERQSGPFYGNCYPHFIIMY